MAAISFDDKLEVKIFDFQFSNSRPSNWNTNPSGNFPGLFRIAWLISFVSKGMLLLGLVAGDFRRLPRLGQPDWFTLAA